MYMTPPELHRTALTLLKQQSELEGNTRWTMQPAMTGKSNGGGGGRRKGVTQVPRIHNILIVQLHQKFEKLIWGQTRHHSTLQMSCYSRRIQRKARLMLHLLKKKRKTPLAVDIDMTLIGQNLINLLPLWDTVTCMECSPILPQV